jgi:hypothetical protein
VPPLLAPVVNMVALRICRIISLSLGNEAITCGGVHAAARRVGQLGQIGHLHITPPASGHHRLCQWLSVRLTTHRLEVVLEQREDLECGIRAGTHRGRAPIVGDECQLTEELPYPYPPAQSAAAHPRYAARR